MSGDRGVGLVLLLAIGLLLVCGCGGVISPEVEAKLSEAKSHFEAASAAISEGRERKKEYERLFIGKTEITTDDLTEAEELLESARESEERALAELAESEKALEQAKELSESNEMDTYIEMKIEETGEQEQVVKLDIQAMTYRIESVIELKLGESVERIAELDKQIAELEEQERQHAAKAKALHEDADDYYREKILGE